jgi:hypothetical protein
MLIKVTLMLPDPFDGGKARLFPLSRHAASLASEYCGDQSTSSGPSTAVRHHVKPPLTGEGKEVRREVVINMWWIYIVMPILFALGIYGFLSWAGVQKRFLTRKTDRTAESMYDEFAQRDRPPRS